jgi:hypothetical protein
VLSIKLLHLPAKIAPSRHRMKIINLDLDGKNADLEFSSHELLFLQKCLAVVPVKLPEDIYIAMIEGISCAEALQLAKVLAEVLMSPTQNHTSVGEIAIVKFLTISENSYQLRISIWTLQGLRSIVNNALHSSDYLKIREEINESTQSYNVLIDFLNNEVIEEFDKDGLSRLVSRHCEQIQYDLGILGKSLTTSDLPSESAHNFILNLGPHIIEVTLHQHDNKRRRLGLLSYSVSEGDTLIFESPKQWFHYQGLLSLAAYLDLAASTSIPDKKPREYWWSISNSLYRNLHKTLLIFQVLPQEDKPTNINMIRLQLMLNTEPTNEHTNIRDNNLTLEEIVDKSSVDSFITTLKKLFARSSA